MHVQLPVLTKQIVFIIIYIWLLIILEDHKNIPPKPH